MNDILKKRIEEAAVGHADSIQQSDERKEYSREDFVAGAKFALSHQLISVDEALPEYGELVLVKHKPMACVHDYQNNMSLAYRGKSAIGDRWIINGMSWLVNKNNKEDNTVVAWMPILKFETKDKEEKQ